MSNISRQTAPAPAKNVSNEQLLQNFNKAQQRERRTFYEKQAKQRRNFEKYQKKKTRQFMEALNKRGGVLACKKCNKPMKQQRARCIYGKTPLDDPNDGCEFSKDYCEDCCSLIWCKVEGCNDARCQYCVEDLKEDDLLCSGCGDYICCNHYTKDNGMRKCYLCNLKMCSNCGYEVLPDKHIIPPFCCTYGCDTKFIADFYD